MNRKTTTSNLANVANAYHTKDGGLIIPHGQFAQEELDQGPDYVDSHVQIGPGSILIFERQLPKQLSIQGDSTVELGPNAFVSDTFIQDSKIKINNKGIVNVNNCQINHTKIALNSTNDTDLINYDIEDSLLKNDVCLISANGNTCRHVYGDSLQASNSNINGGVYYNSAIRNSNIDQPGSTLIYNSTVTDSAIVNHEQSNKHWLALRHEPMHQIEESNIKDSLILNDRHHHFYTSGCQLKNTVSINGLIGELSDIYGPQRKIILNNLEMTSDKLDFRAQQDSMLVAGSKLLNPNVHENDVYYTSLPAKHTFSQNTHNWHFKKIKLNDDLVTKIDQLPTENNKPLDNQAKIVAIDQHLNDTIDKQQKLAITKTDDLDLE